MCCAYSDERLQRREKRLMMAQRQKAAVARRFMEFFTGSHCRGGNTHCFKAKSAEAEANLTRANWMLHDAARSTDELKPIAESFSIRACLSSVPAPTSTPRGCGESRACRWHDTVIDCLPDGSKAAAPVHHLTSPHPGATRASHKIRLCSRRL
jgi:hypothetical protein